MPLTVFQSLFAVSAYLQPVTPGFLYSSTIHAEFLPKIDLRVSSCIPRCKRHEAYDLVIGGPCPSPQRRPLTQKQRHRPVQKNTLTLAQFVCGAISHALYTLRSVGFFAQ